MLRQRRTDGNKTDSVPIKKSKGKATKPKNSPLKFFWSTFLVVVAILYVIIPILFYVSPDIRRHAVFLHYVSFSRHKNLTAPSALGLNCTRNFYIESDDKISLGTWHVPPVQMASRCDSYRSKPSQEFSDSSPIFLYLHGNAGTRGGAHRIQLYKVLSEKLHSHIVAFDYRGFGDSSSVAPTDAGIIKDALNVYEWLTKQVGTKRVFIWGHSLGTGVATALSEMLSQNGKPPLGVILEAPFTKLIDVVRHHPLSFLHRHMPFFDVLFAEPIGKETAGFNSISRIGRVQSPVLILHAEDDGFVPFYQGKELYKEAVKIRPADLYPTTFVAFESKYDYGHKNIYKDPSLPNIIKQFIDNIRVKNPSKT